MTTLLPITRALGVKPVRYRRCALRDPPLTITASAGSTSRFAAARTRPLNRAAVVSTDYQAVDRSHGGKASADDADGVLDDGPNYGVDVRPGCVLMGEALDDYCSVGAGYADEAA